jgi:DNA gyrase subunit A
VAETTAAAEAVGVREAPEGVAPVESAPEDAPEDGGEGEEPEGEG